MHIRVLWGGATLRGGAGEIVPTYLFPRPTLGSDSLQLFHDGFLDPRGVYDLLRGGEKKGEAATTGTRATRTIN